MGRNNHLLHMNKQNIEILQKFLYLHESSPVQLEHREINQQFKSQNNLLKRITGGQTLTSI